MALLFMPCGALSSSFLYLLKNTDHGWSVVDDVGFDCNYDDSVSFEVVPLRRPDADDVIVHHECETYGTGYLEQHFNVFAIVSFKFKLVLDTEEIVKISGWPEADEVDRRSVFAAVPNNGAGSGSIGETRNTMRNGLLTVEKRDFRWSQMRFRFTPSKFVKVDLKDPVQYPPFR